MKSKILLSISGAPDNYISAVKGCGGIPTAEECPKYSPEYDGLILCGGGDIDPSYYGEEINGSRNINVERDEAEFELVKRFVEDGKPILGICRGCQVLNVAFGGTLYQDLANACEHSLTGKDVPLHKVTAFKNSFLYDVYGESFITNSHHHQAVKDLAESFEVTMLAFDGETVEGIKHKALDIFGVQWHPERMCFANLRADAVDGKYVFEQFINLCNKSR